MHLKERTELPAGRQAFSNSLTEKQCPSGSTPVYPTWHVTQMSQIHLLIFDECHHARSRHPYNRIMQQFYHAQVRLWLGLAAGWGPPPMKALP